MTSSRVRLTKRIASVKKAEVKGIEIKKADVGIIMEAPVEMPIVPPVPAVIETEAPKAEAEVVMEVPKVVEPKVMTAGEFFGKLFAARDYFHLAHLNISGSGAYAAHVALNEAYDGILDLTDGMVESYQGLHGIIEIVIPGTSYSVDAISYTDMLCKEIDNNRKMFIESFMQNEIDELQKLLATTLYKLANLK